MMEVLLRFLVLGCVSFGGPVAHVAYFKTTFVERLGWLSEQDFMHKLGLCNILPGPTSSQLGFAIGHHRAGLAGAVAAFIGFTLPSLLIMLGLASIVFFPTFYTTSVTAANAATLMVVAGLKLAALVIVADAVLTMFLTFCRGYFLMLLAVLGMGVFVFLPVSINPLIPMLLGGMVYYLYQRGRHAPHHVPPAAGEVRSNPHGGRIAWLPAGLFLILLASSWYILSFTPTNLNSNLFASFFQVGASTFGGGHVVLPLLFERLDSLVEQDTLLTAYAAAQAVPGPMFTIATFLGADIGLTTTAGSLPSAVGLALVATLAIFVPGFLLLASLLPAWSRFSEISSIHFLMAGVNAVVVGLLASALLDFVAPSALHSGLDLVFAGLIFGLLRYARMPVWMVLMLCIGYGVASATLM